MQKYEIMSFLYSRKHRNCAHRNGGQVNINDFHRQRKDKQQKSRQFVRFGVQKYLFILTHIAGNDVDDFYYGYHSNPNPNPNSQFYCRQNFDRTNCDKHQVRYAVEPRAKFRCRICSPCDDSISDVGKTAEDVKMRLYAKAYAKITRFSLFRSVLPPCLCTSIGLR